MTNYLKARPFIYVALIVILLGSFLFSLAVNSITIGLLLIFFLIDDKKVLKNKMSIVKNNRLLIGFYLFFVAQIVGLIYTENMIIGKEKIIKLLPLLFLPIIAFNEKIDVKFFKLGIEFLKILISITFINFLIIHIFGEGRSLETFVGFVVNDTFKISQFYIAFILLIVFLNAVEHIKKKKYVVYNVFQAVFLLCCMILLQNKTLIIILGIVLIIILFSFLKNYYSLTKSSLSTLGILILFITSIFVFPPIKNKFDILIKTTDFNLEIVKTKNKVTFTKNTLEHRFLINHIALEEVKKSFPIGVGTGDYLDVLYKGYEMLEFKSALRESYNNHNQYLSEFLKTGVLGGFCFLFVIFYFVRKINYSQHYFIFLCLLFTVASFFESYLDRQHGVIIFSFVLPLFYKLEVIDSKHKKNQT